MLSDYIIRGVLESVNDYVPYMKLDNFQKTFSISSKHWKLCSFSVFFSLNESFTIFTWLIRNLVWTSIITKNHICHSMKSKNNVWWVTEKPWSITIKARTMIKGHISSKLAFITIVKTSILSPGTIKRVLWSTKKSKPKMDNKLIGKPLRDKNRLKNEIKQKNKKQIAA